MKAVSIVLPAHEWDARVDLPSAWQLPEPWRYAKRLVLANDSDDERLDEPVEADVAFHARQLADPEREVRVARVADGGAPAEFVASQIHRRRLEDDVVHCRLLFLASVAARSSATYVVLYGNPAADAPSWDTDLSASGAGFALRIENEHYRAVLSELSGNWKSCDPKGWRARLDSGGGHGVEGTIHWGPDWSDERVGRYRITSWDGPPMFDYEVLRGPVCVRVRRWGHPILSLGPQVGRPHKVRATVTYSFWARQPYVIMESRLDVLEDVRFRDCRNDEFVIGEDLPERAWAGPDGAIGFGAHGWDGEDPQWMTYFDRTTGEAFGSVHLDYENTNPRWPQPDGAGFSRTGVWVRAPVHHADMRAGDHVYERNACLLHRFDEGGAQRGFADLVGHRRRLLDPLTQEAAVPVGRPVTRDNVLDALRATNEFELYVGGAAQGPHQLHFIDIGAVRDVAVDGGDIRVDLVMPYAGRETWEGWFAQRVEEQIRARLLDVDSVTVRLVRDPKWTPQRLTGRARRTLGPSDA